MESESTALLTEELGALAHPPDSTGYRESLGRTFFPDASRRSPSCVVTPTSAADVATVVRIAGRTGSTVTVRGGGLSSNCVADGSIMMDLSVFMNSARPQGEAVVVDGGSTVGTMLDAMAPARRIVPVGIAEHAGFGLIARGGIGYYTRSLGLTLDHLSEVELVLPDGESARLSHESRGEEAELWWAVRGCAPPFGVIVSATLRTHEVGTMWVDRMLIGLDALPTYFRIAPQLPRHTSMGAVLGYSDSAPGRPVFFVYTACASRDPADIDVGRCAATEVARASSEHHYRSETTGRYLSGLPQYSPPGRGGTDPAPMSLPQPGDRRGSFFGKALFVGPTLDAQVAEALAHQISRAPTRACRIDFQQTGGALSDIGDTDTAFWGRSSEWNIPLNAIWDDPADGPACTSWARDTLSALSGHRTGVYSVEVRPGFTETDDETAAAFGGNLSRLRAARRQHDPTGVFATYPL
ncbi:FAD-dependent oxidoreductase [Rhodococcoides yunnanense]|uniref:FAD-dependent oxidoreductase n=1 Tax=Rhodococcoides yunnanense TaxID=278209 RepID=UPI000932F1A4|nr:FAD-binding oxidoreductase [Rhodococcus yunnanensis]